MGEGECGKGADVHDRGWKIRYFEGVHSELKFGR